MGKVLFETSALSVDLYVCPCVRPFVQESRKSVAHSSFGARLNRASPKTKPAFSDEDARKEGAAAEASETTKKTEERKELKRLFGAEKNQRRARRD